VVLGAVGGIVAGGRFAGAAGLPHARPDRLREIFTAAALLLVVGIALLMTKVGLSPALGTFLAGVVLADSEYRHELESDIEPFKGLLLGLFFISVGASDRLRADRGQPAADRRLVARPDRGQAGGAARLGRVVRLSIDRRAGCWPSRCAQGGEFAFVLLSVASGGARAAAEVAAPLVAAVALSMLVTPLRA
jgi:Kef-type K+ transport system membrane component KefB